MFTLEYLHGIVTCESVCIPIPVYNTNKTPYA